MLDKPVSHPLSAYQTPSSALEGVWIDLDNAPGVRVRVLLPTSYNQRFKVAMYNEIGDAAELRTGDRVTAMKTAFSTSCILEVDGADVPLPLDPIEYISLIDELWDKAGLLAQEEAESVEAKLEKLKPT